MNLHITHPGTSQSRPETGMKFTYSCGSRPLDGYTIKRGIGRGGFGEVYFATSDAGKEVALKLIRRNLDIELRGVTQCLNLKHPNLLSLYDIRQDDQGDSWVVMEYVGGDCLEQVVQRYPSGMPIPEVLSWMHGIAAAVAYLHDHGIVHRDLKPGNVFSDEGIVKVGDYGLSKFISCSRRSGQTGSVGTVHYMAPEVANGRYGKEIDIYALGVILYEMIAGHVPFEGESVGEVLMKHLTATPDVSKLAEPYRTIVSRALTKDPEQRFRSVPEMIALLPRPAIGAVGTFVPAVEVSPALAHPEPVKAQSLSDKLLHFSPAAVVHSISNDDDPVLKVVKRWMSETREWWNREEKHGSRSPLVKFAIVAALMFTPHIWASALFGALVFYAIYRVGRGVRIAWNGPPVARIVPVAQPYALRPPPAAAAPAQVVPVAAPTEQQQPNATSQSTSPTLRRWRERAREHYIQKSLRQKIMELAGSMLEASVVTAVVSLILLVIRGEQPEANQFLWLWLVSTFAAWSILMPSKLWEGSTGEASLRRFTMLMVGLLVAASAYSIYASLLVKLPYLRDVTLPTVAGRNFHNNFYGPDGSPMLLAFLAYFSFLFVVPRWWCQADPLRSSRFSLWSTAVCIFWAAALNMFWPFPQPWGMMLAASTSVALQLASTWTSPKERAALRQQERGA